MMKVLFRPGIFACLILFFPLTSDCQVYEDYMGAGQNVGVSVTGSPHSASDTSLYSISGTTLIPDLAEASRFLSQATLGANYEEIEHVSTIGIEAWIEEQLALTPTSYMDRWDDIYAETQTLISNTGFANQYISFTFYDVLFNDPDFLRQKVGFALSQIFVVSRDNVLSGEPEALMTYHDILYQGAFGNYRDLIEEITYSVAMAKFLSHFRNQRADVIGARYPDENFAREIMQLFSIGLEKLNIDGTPQLDGSGNIIPTYNIDHVAELSKVFTGLGGAFDVNSQPNDNFFNGIIDDRLGTKMFDDFHSIGPKAIFDGIVIPAGQTGDEDIEQALDALFNHQNVGPFMAKRLIQHLVKSNPTPAYVKRVAMVFNNNGQGVRGDLEAVVKAVLLDPEARNCDLINGPENGKLIQPIERFTTLFKAFDISSPSGTMWLNDSEDYGIKLLQSFQNANTVFNFFSPFYSEEDIVDPLGLVSPEFEILDGNTAVKYINEVEFALKNRPFTNRTAASPDGLSMGFNENDNPVLDFTDEIAIYQTEGVPGLLERLDILLCRGQLSQEVKDIIINTMEENLDRVNGYDVNNVLWDTIYYIMLSPNFMIQK